MVIDISLMLDKDISRIELNEEVNIPKELYENSEILDLKDLKFNGYIEKIDSEISVVGNLTGIMVLADSISLEEINHEFSAEIDEKIEDFLENSLNILDITDVLWQNIVLEVPLKLTNVDNFDEYHGDGWKLVSEDSVVNTNNPFKELEDMLREE